MYIYVNCFRGIVTDLKEKKTELLNGINEFTEYFNSHNCAETNEMKGEFFKLTNSIIEVFTEIVKCVLEHVSMINDLPLKNVKVELAFSGKAETSIEELNVQYNRLIVTTLPAIQICTRTFRTALTMKLMMSSESE